MAMFDPEDVNKLKMLPKDVMLQSFKSCLLELYIQVGETADDCDGGDAKKYLEWLQDSIGGLQGSIGGIQDSIGGLQGSIGGMQDSVGGLQDSIIGNTKERKCELTQAFETTITLLRRHAQSFDPVRQSVKELLLDSSSPVDKDKGRSSSSSDVILLNEFLQTTFVSDGTRLHKTHSSSSSSEHYCCEMCGCLSTVPRQLISHSASVESLIQLFKFQLPDLSDLNVLDIGSGLGSILYGAYFFSKAAQIRGIELNEGFHHVVRKVIDKYNLGDRVEIVQGDIMDHADAFKAHQVIVFNNVLEFFTPLEVQRRIWKFLRESIEPGSIFVTNPDLTTLLDPLDLTDMIEDWVEPFTPVESSSILLGLPDTDEIFCTYKVKQPKSHLNNKSD